MLSDLLVDLFKNIADINIEISEDIDDQILQDIELSQDLQSSLDKITSRAGIFWIGKDGNTIKLSSKQSFQITASSSWLYFS